MQKTANLVDLEKCCKMGVWLQKSALIQLRRSLSKFSDAYMPHPPPVISSAPPTPHRAHVLAHAAVDLDAVGREQHEGEDVRHREDPIGPELPQPPI